MKQILIALKATLVLTLLTGVMYPLLVTGLAKALFRDKADGSLIQAKGRTVGSELIGQRFTKPEYFHGRPSAAGNDGYDATASGGSNLGPTSRKLAERQPVPRHLDPRRGKARAYFRLRFGMQQQGNAERRSGSLARMVIRRRADATEAESPPSPGGLEQDRRDPGLGGTA